MKRISEKQIKGWLTSRGIFVEQGAELVSRNGYYAVEINNGRVTLFTGTLREIAESVSSYLAGYRYATDKHKLGF